MIFLYPIFENEYLRATGLRRNEWGEIEPIDDNDDEEDDDDTDIEDEYVPDDEKSDWDRDKSSMVGHIVLPSDMIKVRQYYYAFTEVTSVITSPNTRKICVHAFMGCKELEYVEILEGLECIDSFAFSDCPKLKTVKLPSTIKEMGADPFLKCDSLEKIIVPASTGEMFLGMDGLYFHKDIIYEEGNDTPVKKPKPVVADTTNKPSIGCGVLLVLMIVAIVFGLLISYAFKISGWITIPVTLIIMVVLYKLVASK